MVSKAKTLLEAFAEEFAEESGYSPLSIMLVVAGYNPKGDRFSLRAELSGIPSHEWERILVEFESRKMEIKARFPVSVKFNEKITFLANSMEEVERRYEEEMKRKQEIFPLVKRVSEDFVERVVKSSPHFCEHLQLAFLRGSASPRSPKPFFYYLDANGNYTAISDVDVTLVFDLPTRLVLRAFFPTIKRIARDVSFASGMEINPWVSSLDRFDNAIFRFGYPIYVSPQLYEI